MKIAITSTLELSTNKQHIPHSFTLPAGTQRLAIRFDYTDTAPISGGLENQLSLTVFDPEGARGARHCNPDQSLVLTADSSTPGYTTGALQPGVWTVWIDVHRLLVPADYTLTIEMSSAAPSEPPVHYVKGTVAPRGQGWYRGDLHGHTLHSDGAWDVPDFVEYGRHYKLDFVTLTDHNTVAPLAQHDSLAADDLLTMGGVELTGFAGHALALGTRQWMEWRVGIDGQTMPMLAQRVMDSGALFIIAHPMSEGDPACTGCDWTHADMLPGNARCVEIWNGMWEQGSNNDLAVDLWYRWLNEGYRMVATRGTDIHGKMDPAPENPGFNVVYAAELNETAILDAIRRGHLYLSAGPALELTATNAAGDHAMMGDLIDGDMVEVNVQWRDCRAGDTLRIIIDGHVVETLPVEGMGEYRRSLMYPAAHWLVCEIRDAHQHMRAITNPLFLGSEADWR